MACDKDDISSKDIEDSDLERIDFLACLLRNHQQHPRVKGDSVILSSEILRDLNASLFGTEK